jgi:hypothetical protein
MAEQKELSQAELMQMKLRLMETIRTAGWAYIQRFAETIVRELEREAINEDDDTKATGLRRDARGAQKFKDRLFSRIQIATSFEKEPSADTFLDIATD